MQVFIGLDPRQPIAVSVLAMSIWRRASKPVSITPLILNQLPITRKGLTEFTFSRYLVPWLCGFEGRALFLDADMVVTGDVCELDQYQDPNVSVGVVKGQKRFEWPSLMYFNCDRCTLLTPDWIENPNNNPFTLEWATDGIGSLPAEWNHCVGYDLPREDAKLLHFTMGLPIWPETSKSEKAEVWFQEHRVTNASVSYEELMGNSVHDKIVRHA